jgi:hypothetical protein
VLLRSALYIADFLGVNSFPLKPIIVKILLLPSKNFSGVFSDGSSTFSASSSHNQLLRVSRGCTSVCHPGYPIIHRSMTDYYWIVYQIPLATLTEKRAPIYSGVAGGVVYSALMCKVLVSVISRPPVH